MARPPFLLFRPFLLFLFIGILHIIKIYNILATETL